MIDATPAVLFQTVKVGVFTSTMVQIELPPRIQQFLFDSLTALVLSASVSRPGMWYTSLLFPCVCSSVCTALMRPT